LINLLRGVWRFILKSIVGIVLIGKYLSSKNASKHGQAASCPNMVTIGLGNVGFGGLN
jgi:hypothetical protein